VAKVTEDQFWALIESAQLQSNGNQEAQLEHLQRGLEPLGPDDLLEFQRIFTRLHQASYQAKLWGAAFLMNGGASDDGFDYFRGWLIAQGRKVFEAALENPDSLAETVDEDAEADFGFENEAMLSIAMDAWTTKTGLKPNVFYKKLGTTPKQDVEFGDNSLWSDDGDADDEKCKIIYPKLWERFDWES
jgi:Protein of unknown function (DUF4240)